MTYSLEAGRIEEEFKDGETEAQVKSDLSKRIMENPGKARIGSLTHSFFHTVFVFFLFFFGFFLGPLPRHLEVSRLRVESELQLPAFATATATTTPDLRRVCDLHHSSRQHGILNPLRETGDRTRVLMDASWVRFC